MCCLSKQNKKDDEERNSIDQLGKVSEWEIALRFVKLCQYPETVTMTMMMMLMPRRPGSCLRRKRLCASALTSLSSGLGSTPLGTAGRNSPTSRIVVASESTSASALSSIHHYHYHQLSSDVSIFAAKNTKIIMRGQRSEQRWCTTTRTPVSSSSSSSDKTKETGTLTTTTAAAVNNDDDTGVRVVVVNHRCSLRLSRIILVFSAAKIETTELR